MNYFHTINIDCNSDEAKISLSQCHKHFYFENIIIPPKNHHLVLALSNFIMPYSFYQIREGINDTFTITSIFDVNTIYEEIITIAEGNYNVKTFTYYLSQLLLDLEDNLNCLIQCFFNSSNNKLYFTCSESDITIDFLFSNSLYQIMGFNELNNSYNNMVTFYAPNTYNFSGCTALYIKLYNMGIRNLNSSNLCDIISCVNIEVLPGGMIYFNPNQIDYFKINRDYLNEIEIEVLDDNFIPLTNLGTRFRFTLSVHFENNNNSDEKIISNNEIYNTNDEETIENA